MSKMTSINLVATLRQIESGLDFGQSNFVDRPTLDLLSWYAVKYLGSQSISNRIENLPSKSEADRPFSETDLRDAYNQFMYVKGIIQHMIRHIETIGIVREKRNQFFRFWTDSQVFGTIGGLISVSIVASLYFGNTNGYRSALKDLGIYKEVYDSSPYPWGLRIKKPIQSPVEPIQESPPVEEKNNSQNDKGINKKDSASLGFIHDK